MRKWHVYTSFSFRKVKLSIVWVGLKEKIKGWNDLDGHKKTQNLEVCVYGLLSYLFIFSGLYLSLKLKLKHKTSWIKLFKKSYSFKKDHEK